MKLSHFYTKAIEAGIEHDPRGKEIIQKELERVRKEYDRLSEKEKETFDRERLGNPYADSRIPFGTGDERIGTILVGIDIDVGEVLFQKRCGTPPSQCGHCRAYRQRQLGIEPSPR